MSVEAEMAHTDSIGTLPAHAILESFSIYATRAYANPCTEVYATFCAARQFLSLDISRATPTTGAEYMYTLHMQVPLPLTAKHAGRRSNCARGWVIL